MHSSLPGFIVFLSLWSHLLSHCVGKHIMNVLKRNLYERCIDTIWRNCFIPSGFIVFVFMENTAWYVGSLTPSVTNIVQTFKAYYYWRGYWFLFSWGDLRCVTCGVITHAIICVMNDWYKDSIVAGLSLSPPHNHTIIRASSLSRFCLFLNVSIGRDGRSSF